MLGAIKYNLSHLLDFQGRDARQTFWYYVLFVFLLNMIVSMAIVIPYVGAGMTAAISAAQSGDPDSVNAAMMQSMGGMIETTIWSGVIMGLANLILLAAAFTRRLHDSGHSGFWALAVAIVHLASQAYTIANIGNARAVMDAALAGGAEPTSIYAMSPGMGVQSLIAWLPILVFLGFGILKSTDGPNRFGDEPVRF